MRGEGVREMQGVARGVRGENVAASARGFLMGASEIGAAMRGKIVKRGGSLVVRGARAGAEMIARAVVKTMWGERILAVMLGVFGALSGVGFAENKVFVGIGGGIGSQIKTQFSQEITKANNSCDGGVCKGGRSMGEYAGLGGASLRFVFGNEKAFDALHISGLRFYGGVEVGEASLGSLQGQAITHAAIDKNFDTIISVKPDGTPIIGKVPMLSPKTQQNFLLGNALSTNFMINLDFFANLPLDYFLQKRWESFPYFKLGVFGGLGVEFNLLKSNYWVNESLDTGREGAFYASGGGLFVNLGGSVNLTHRDRLEVGVKIPLYGLKYELWSKVNATNNIWAEQILHQSFAIKRGSELRVTYVYYF